MSASCLVFLYFSKKGEHGQGCGEQDEKREKKKIEGKTGRGRDDSKLGGSDWLFCTFFSFLRREICGEKEEREEEGEKEGEYFCSLEPETQKKKKRNKGEKGPRPAALHFLENIVIPFIHLCATSHWCKG